MWRAEDVFVILQPPPRPPSLPQFLSGRQRTPKEPTKEEAICLELDLQGVMDLTSMQGGFQREVAWLESNILNVGVDSKP